VAWPMHFFGSRRSPSPGKIRISRYFGLEIVSMFIVKNQKFIFKV
jgi:hypothetical protein